MARRHAARRNGHEAQQTRLPQQQPNVRAAGRNAGRHGRKKEIARWIVQRGEVHAVDERFHSAGQRTETRIDELLVSRDGLRAAQQGGGQQAHVQTVDAQTVRRIGKTSPGWQALELLERLFHAFSHLVGLQQAERACGRAGEQV